MSFVITIPCKYIAAASYAASVYTDEPRTYLRGIHFRPHKSGRVMVEASNGHIAVQAVGESEWPEGLPSVLIEFPRDVLREIRKIGNANEPVNLWWTSDAEVALEIGSRQFLVLDLPTVNATFPNIDSIYENSSVQDEIGKPFPDELGFSTTYLRAVDEVARALKGHSAKPKESGAAGLAACRFQFNGRTRVDVEFRDFDPDLVRMAVMPCRF